MTILYYELLKLGKKRLLVSAVGILFFASCFLYLYSEWKNQPELIAEKAHYEKLEAEFREIDQGEGLARTAAMASELQFFQLLASEAIISTIDADWMKMIAEQKRDNPEAVKRYVSSPYVDDEELLKRDFFIYEKLKHQYEALEDHRAYISEIKERSSDMLSVSIFYNKDSFSYRNIQKTLKDFELLQSIELEIGLENGVVSATRFTPTDLCLLMLLFIICYYLFHYERETGQLRLIRSTLHGRVTNSTAKTGALLLLTLLLSIVFYSSLLGIAYYLYGFGEVGRLIQSMPSFKNSAVPWTVGQYIGYYLLLKTLACLLISILIALLFTWFRRPVIVFLVMLAGVGVSYFLYHHIHPNSYMNSLKYLNPIAFMDTFSLIAEYRNINLWGYPFIKTQLSYLIGAIVILIMMCFLWISYAYQWTLPIQLNVNKLTGRMRLWFFKYRSYNFLYHHELFKLLITGRGWWILTVTIILSVQMLNSSGRSFTMNESIYNQYMSQLSGPINDETSRIIESESFRYAQLGVESKEWEEKYQAGAVSDKEYNDKKLEWSTLEKREKAFRIVEQQYGYLLEIKERTAINVGMVNQITSDELFNRQSRDILYAMLSLVLLIPLLSILFTQDFRNNNHVLLRSTRNGRDVLFRRKLFIAYGTVILLLILLDCPKYLQLLWHYPPIDLSLPIQSIQAYSGLSWEVTIIEYIWIVKAVQVIGCLILVHVSYLVSILVRKQALSLLLQGALFIVPLVLAYLGYAQVVAFTFNGVFLAAYSINSAQATIIAIAYMGSLILVGLGAAFMSWKLFNGPTARKE